ncbi:MAG: ATP-binding protein [Verrucomicrobia bacterium]|jgi:hypothetical protein|nr:ATP-binding protein [Verrucomicrobiota bacterium]
MDHGSLNEFTENSPMPREGMTSVDAVYYLNGQCPEVKTWTCWCPRYGDEWFGLARIPVGVQKRGKIGPWSWKLVKTSYPQSSYWLDSDIKGCLDARWVGLIEVKGQSGEQFLLFSFLSSRGTIGSLYISSTDNRKVLRAFAGDLWRHFYPIQDRITIDVFGGRDIKLEPAKQEDLVLPAGMRSDIESQLDSFLNGADEYRKRGILCRRGFLFVGPPGNGKTMMVRELVRRAWSAHKPRIIALLPTKDTDESDLNHVFMGGNDAEKRIVILEEIDVLLNETRITKASLLDRLDGLSSPEGVLVIATTNNPGNVDPALAHRPSRFDRVWQFEQPDHDLRVQYLRKMCTGLPDADVQRLAADTEGWSFAYLNELRTTAAILSIQQSMPSTDWSMLSAAYDLLAAQFQSGRKNHVGSVSDSHVGFKVA